MKKRLVLVFMVVFLVLPAVHAQDNADVWTTADLNLRSGPGTGNSAITLLPAQTALLAEARSADNGWLLVHTPDGSLRGWVVVRYLQYRAGFDPATLPASSEIIAAGAAPAADGQQESSGPANGAIDSQVEVYRTDRSVYYAITYWSDGIKVTGYLGYPTADGPFPAIILNRGGAWNNGALRGFEIAPYVEAGYVTVGSQYRGNMGSGGNEQFGWDEVNDVLNLIPLLKSLPMVDGNRIGMVGGSRGGMVTYMALKAETMRGTHDIKAAVTIGGISDLFAWAEANPDIVKDVYLPLIHYTPAQAPDLYQMRSAIYWPELINTPILLLHGGGDTIVPVEQSINLHKALIAAGKTASLMTFPGDDHPLTGQLGGLPIALHYFNNMLRLPGDPDREFETNYEHIHSAMGCMQGMCP